MDFARFDLTIPLMLRPCGRNERLPSRRAIRLEKIANCCSPVLVWIDIVPLKEFRQCRDDDLRLHAARRKREQLDIVIERGSDDEGDSFPVILRGHDETRRHRGRKRAVIMRRGCSSNTIGGDGLFACLLLQ